MFTGYACSILQASGGAIEDTLVYKPECHLRISSVLGDVAAGAESTWTNL